MKREDPSGGRRSREAEIEGHAPSILRPERPPGPALSWAGALVLAVVADVFLGRWALLPILGSEYYSNENTR